MINNAKMSFEGSNLRSKVNMLVQKGQISEPTVRYTFLDELKWHCHVEIFIDGKTKHADAEATTKALSYEQALTQFTLPAVKQPRSSVPDGTWNLAVNGENIGIEHTTTSGVVKTEQIKNTSNIFAVMIKMSKNE